MCSHRYVFFSCCVISKTKNKGAFALLFRAFSKTLFFVFSLRWVFSSWSFGIGELGEGERDKKGEQLWAGGEKRKRKRKRKEKKRKEKKRKEKKRKEKRKERKEKKRKEKKKIIIKT